MKKQVKPFLTEQQQDAFAIAKGAGYITTQAIPLSSLHSRLKCDVVAVFAIKGDERYILKVSTDKKKILSADLLLTQFDPRDATKILWVKKFARPIK